MSETEWGAVSELPALLADQMGARRAVDALCERTADLIIAWRSGTVTAEEFAQRNRLLQMELFLVQFLMNGQQAKIDTLLKRVQK